MQDAINLAWKLALVCRKACAEKLLDSYSAERSAVGEQVLKAAGRLTAVAIMKNHTAQTVRDMLGRVLFGFAPVRQAMAETMTEVAIGYEHSPLNGPKAHGISGPKAGERLVPVAGQTPAGAGNRPCFALFTETSGAVTQLLEKFGASSIPTFDRRFIRRGCGWFGRMGMWRALQKQAIQRRSPTIWRR